MSRILRGVIFCGSAAVGAKIGVNLPSDSRYPSEFQSFLESHPYIAELKQQGWEQQPQDIPPWHKRNMVLTGLLAGKGKFEAPPVSLVQGQKRQTVFQLGNAWGPTIENGVLVTILDHNLAATACPKRALTKSLDVEFFKDAKPGVLVLQSEQGEVRTRSATASGTVYQLEGSKVGAALARGEVLMVRPKWAGSF